MNLHVWKSRALVSGAGIAGVLLVIAAVRYARRVPIATWAAPVDVVSLVSVPGGVAAESLLHGPRVSAAGCAAGFSHDVVGAAVAASNLAPRVNAAAGRMVSEGTLREQCCGDVPAALAQLRAGVSAAPPSDQAGVAALYFRVLARDASGDEVVVSLLTETTTQARRPASLSRRDLTLRWSGGDWRLCVPLPRPTVHAGTAGYTPLGWAR